MKELLQGLVQRPTTKAMGDAAEDRALAHLRRAGAPPPCRFDVVTVEGDGVQWLRAAFDAG